MSELASEQFADFTKELNIRVVKSCRKRLHLHDAAKLCRKRLHLHVLQAYILSKAMTTRRSSAEFAIDAPTLSLLCRDGADVQNIIAADESVTVLVLQLTVDVFLCLRRFRLV